jgi:hypothetical protein
MKGQSGSFIVPLLTRFFSWMRYISILELVRRTLGKWNSYRAVEAFVLCWLSVELLSMGLLCGWPTLSKIGIFFIPVTFLLIIRLMDLLQVSFNVLLFDRIRSGHAYKIASPTRLLVLNLVNYVEISIIFGVLAFLARDAFYPEFRSIWHSFYYSIGVITTLGVNIEPTAIQGKVMFLTEIALGLVFILLIIGRAVSMLPPVRAIDKY